MDLNELEKRVDEIGERVEKRIDELAKHIEERFSQKNNTPPQFPPSYQHRARIGGSFWGIALIAFGIVLLNNHFDWFDLNIPLLPAILIILGLYLVFETKN
jgi:hypothetical protein